MLRQNTGKYHAFINPDTELKDDVMAHLVDVMEKNSDIVVIAPKIMHSDGTEQQLPKRHPKFKYLLLGRLARLGGVFKKNP